MRRFLTLLLIVLTACAGPPPTGTEASQPMIPSLPAAPLPTSTPADEPGVEYILQNLDFMPGISFINESGKKIGLREEILMAFISSVKAEPNAEWPVEIVIVPTQKTLLEIYQGEEGGKVLTMFKISGYDERSLNAGLTAAIGLIRHEMNEGYLITYGHSAIDMGIMNASLMGDLTYEKYVTWALDLQRIPLTGVQGVVMQEKWVEFKDELDESGVETFPLFIP